MYRNPDVAQVQIDPVIHYVLYGFKEGRTPYPNDGIEFINYCLNHPDIGLSEKIPDKVQEIVRKYGLFDRRLYLQQNPDVAQQIADIKFIKKYNLLYSEVYLYRNPDVAQAKMDPVIHYVLYGVKEGRAPYPNDDIEIITYFLNHPDIGLSEKIPDKIQEIVRKYGLWDKDLANRIEEIKVIKEYNLLDGELYLQQNPDIAKVKYDPMVHYVLYGLKEGRTPFPKDISVSCFKQPYIYLGEKIPNIIEKVIRKYGLFDSNLYLLQNPDVAQLKMDPLDHYILHGLKEGRRLYPDLRLTSMIQNQINGAVQCEPGIVALSPGVRPNIKAPFHDSIYFLHKEIKNRLRATKYDTIMCLPWVRMGGADHHAGQLAYALRRLCPDETILLLRTDTTHFERPEWFPKEIDTVDLSDLFAQSGLEAAERLLYVMFLGLNPSRIVNINSSFCWQAFRRFGKRLAHRINLYGFLFCWDLTETGVRVGYPSEFYPATGGFLSGILTDSIFLKEELIYLYAVPPSLQNRIFALSLPVHYSADTPTVAERAIISRHLRKRPIVLWAGRLDKQKRFDLVQAIASQMPDVDFLCWGKVVLDSPPDLSNCPSNVLLHPAFRSLDELPLSEADVWLFTSSWEGTPSMLIEVAMKGMPVVASAVGGVPEVINNDTGWLITSINDVEAYVAALQEAIDNPTLRVKKALNLQQLTTSRHSREKFDADIQQILLHEKRHDRHYSYSQCA